MLWRVTQRESMDGYSVYDFYRGAQLKGKYPILVLLLILTGCASTSIETSYTYSSRISPKWYRYLPNTPRTIAIFPFEAYDGLSKGLATRLESSIRSKILQWDQYRLVERQYLSRILSEQDMGLMGLTEYKASSLAKMAGADWAVLGNVSDYSQEEIYLKHEKGQTYTADKYRRLVSFSANMRIISVATGQIVYEQSKQFWKSSEGYRNIRTFEPKETEDKAEAFFTALEMLVVGVGGLEKLSPYTTLKDKALSEAVNWFFYDIVPYRKKYKNTYRVVNGKRTLQSRAFIGNVK